MNKTSGPSQSSPEFLPIALFFNFTLPVHIRENQVLKYYSTVFEKGKLLLPIKQQETRQHGCSGCTNPQIFVTPLILRLLALCAPADFETQSYQGCTCTRRSKFLTHSLIMSGKTPIHIFSIFGSKTKEFELKKIGKNPQKFQNPKSCRQFTLTFN